MFIKPLEFLQKKRNLLVPHRATVKDNVDHKKLGRVKIEIKGLIEGSTEKLPWAYPLSPHMFGGGSNISSFVVPDMDSELVVFFPYEDIYFPMYTGYWQTSSTHQTEFDADYPETYGCRDKINNKMVVNRQQETINFTTSSEITVDTDKDGNVVIFIPGNRTETIEKSHTETILENEKIEVGINSEKTILGSDTESIAGSKNKSVTQSEIDNIAISKTETVGVSLTQNAGVSIILNAPVVTITGGIINIIGAVTNLGGQGGKPVVVNNDQTTVNGTHPHSHQCIASTVNANAT